MTRRMRPRMAGIPRPNPRLDRKDHRAAILNLLRHRPQTLKQLLAKLRPKNSDHVETLALLVVGIGLMIFGFKERR